MAPGAAGAGATAGAGAGPASAGGVMRAMGGSLLGGGGLGSLIGGGLNYLGAQQGADAQRDANAANVDLAREQMSWSASQAQREMDFQERMSGSSYQRATEDMRKAGINPMLAVTNGGASTPAGAMGNGSAGRVDAVPSVLSNSIASSMDMIRTFASTKQALASASLAASQAKKADADTTMLKAKTPESEFSGRFFKFFNTILDRLPFSANAKDSGKAPITYEGPRTEAEWDPYWHGGKTRTIDIGGN